MKLIEDGHPVALEGIQESNMDEADKVDVSAIVGVEDTVNKMVSQLAVKEIGQAEVAVIKMGSFIEDHTACM